MVKTTNQLLKPAIYIYIYNIAVTITEVLWILCVLFAAAMSIDLPFLELRADAGTRQLGESSIFSDDLPSGNLSNSYGKSQFLMGKSHYKWPFSIAI